jgi:hypothetical protein
MAEDGGNMLLRTVDIYLVPRSSGLKMEAVSYTETLVSTYYLGLQGWILRQYVPPKSW